MKLGINWQRVLRTAVQAAAGALATVLTSIGDGTITWKVLVGFAVTVIVAALMNIQKQLEG